jgi:hypothetical protein
MLAHPSGLNLVRVEPPTDKPEQQSNMPEDQSNATHSSHTKLSARSRYHAWWGAYVFVVSLGAAACQQEKKFSSTPFYFF